jgi:alginate O-acetyltransferase complex protein AlgJ
MASRGKMGKVKFLGISPWRRSHRSHIVVADSDVGGRSVHGRFQSVYLFPFLNIMAKYFKSATLVIFASFLWAPMLQQKFAFVKYEALTENRLRKTVPRDWISLFERNSSFSREFEDSFNDNYGFRDLLIRTKNQVDFSLFRRSDKVFVGRGDWLFYRSVLEQEQVAADRESDETWNGLFDRFLALNRTLASRGITLVVIPCPMKSTIYPENVPVNAPRRRAPSAYERYRTFLLEHPEIVTIDPFPILVSLKNSFQVYFRTDFHWTDPAGAEVAKALVNRLGGLSGKGKLWEAPVAMKIAAQLAGGENHSLGLLWPLREMAPYLESDHPETALGDYSYTKEANEWTWRTKLADTSRLIPPTVMFGDSYADAFLRAGFTGYFEKLQKFYNWDFRARFSQIPEGTRFVVFEHIESLFGGLQNPEMWPLGQ